MEKRAFFSRFVVPVLVVFLLMAASFAVYSVAWKINAYVLQQVLSTVSGVILFFTIAFGTFVVYPMAYFRGASAAERIIASLINPFAWATKEVVRITMSFTLAESLYFYLSPLQVAVFFAAVAEMGLAELLCRRAAKKRGEPIAVFSIPSIAALVAGLAVVAFLFAWEQGVYAFYIFIEGFRGLFGPGVGV
jgi:hypothetical protein